VVVSHVVARTTGGPSHGVWTNMATAAAGSSPPGTVSEGASAYDPVPWISPPTKVYCATSSEGVALTIAKASDVVVPFWRCTTAVTAVTVVRAPAIGGAS